MQLLIYFVVVGQFLGAARGIPDFAIYIFTGLTAMGLFTEIVVGGTGSIVANAGLVKKVYVPREVFPLASVGLGAVQLRRAARRAARRHRPRRGSRPLHWEILYVVPALAAPGGLRPGVRAAASALLNVYLRDMQYLVEVGTMLLFWASPIVYSWQMVAIARSRTRCCSRSTRTTR